MLLEDRVACEGLHRPGPQPSLSSHPSSSVVSSLGAPSLLEGWTSSFCPCHQGQGHHPGGQGHTLAPKAAQPLFGGTRTVRRMLRLPGLNRAEQRWWRLSRHCAVLATPDRTSLCLARLCWRGGR